MIFKLSIRSLALVGKLVFGAWPRLLARLGLGDCIVRNGDTDFCVGSNICFGRCVLWRIWLRRNAPQNQIDHSRDGHLVGRDGVFNMITHFVLH